MIRHISKLLYGDPEGAPADQVQLGEHAKRLLADPVLALALQRIERRLVESWQATAIVDLEKREAAYRLHWATAELRAELGRLLGDGKMLAAELKRQDEAERRAQERRER